jgi:hypothetical protein
VLVRQIVDKESRAPADDTRYGFQAMLGHVQY